MTPKRIYVVHDDGKPIALIRASSQAAAIRHAMKDRFEAVVADQDHLVSLLPKLTVQDAAGEETQAETRG